MPDNEQEKVEQVEVAVVAQEEAIIKVPDDALAVLKNFMIMLRPTIMRILKLLETPQDKNIDAISIADLKIDEGGNLAMIIKGKEGRTSKIKMPKEELNKILGVLKNE